MKILIFSDFQAWPYLQHARTVRYKPFNYPLNSRFVNALRVLKQINKIRIENGVDLCVFAGDLFENATVDPDYLYAVRDLIWSLGKTFLISGNHDLGRSGKTSILDFMELDDQVTSVSGKRRTELCGVLLFLIPWSDHIKDDFAKVRSEMKSRDIVIAHAGLHDVMYRGIFLKGEPIGIKDLPKKGFTFLGHIHDPKKITDNAIYIGACQHHNIGDFKRKNYAILVEVGKHISYKRIELKGSRYVMTGWDAIDWNDVKGNFMYLSGKEKKGTRDKLIKAGALAVVDNSTVTVSEQEEKVFSLDPGTVIREVSGQIKHPRFSSRDIKEAGLSIYGNTLIKGE